jgi:hypothetical protein
LKSASLGKKRAAASWLVGRGSNAERTEQAG